MMYGLVLLSLVLGAVVQFLAAYVQPNAWIRLLQCLEQLLFHCILVQVMALSAGLRWELAQLICHAVAVWHLLALCAHFMVNLELSLAKTDGFVGLLRDSLLSRLGSW